MPGNLQRDTVMGSSILSLRVSNPTGNGRSHHHAWGERGAQGGNSRRRIPWGLALGDLLPTLACILPAQPVPELARGDDYLVMICVTGGCKISSGPGGAPSYLGCGANGAVSDARLEERSRDTRWGLVPWITSCWVNSHISVT